MADQPSPRRRFQFRLRTLMVVVTLLSLAVGCGQSEPLPNSSPQNGQLRRIAKDPSAAEASTSSQQLCANFIRQAMGSNEVRFKDLGDSQAIQFGPQKTPMRQAFVSWEVRKNDYWEQHTTVIFLPPEQIDSSKQYSAVGDVEGRAGAAQLWITEADAKDVIPQLPSGDNANDNRPAHK
jgi:hypothetical protein